ncbi:MAG: hypothetical protein IT371_17450 [Deltaproteobacteria bacterium]|nr:hypothetical protein [Deltaproteobacteria bacterium]
MTTETKIPSVTNGTLNIETSMQGPSVVVTMVGSAEAQSPDFLQSFFGRLHAEALRSQVTEVAVDLRRVEFLNSVSLKAFVSWIVELEEENSAHRYRIRFVSDTAVPWQRRSLQALRALAADLIVVDS